MRRHNSSTKADDITDAEVHEKRCRRHAKLRYTQISIAFKKSSCISYSSGGVVVNKNRILHLHATPGALQAGLGDIPGKRMYRFDSIRFNTLLQVCISRVSKQT